MFKKIPLSFGRNEERLIASMVERNADGCLIVQTESPKHNPQVLIISGQRWAIGRVAYALANCDTGQMDSCEVIHIAECPNTGGEKPDGTYYPLCIEPSHLCLGSEELKAKNRDERGRTSHHEGLRCQHGDEDRSPTGACRICNRAAQRRCKERKRAATAASPQL
jgi:hypothetical protein